MIVTPLCQPGRGWPVHPLHLTCTCGISGFLLTPSPLAMILYPSVWGGGHALTVVFSENYHFSLRLSLTVLWPSASAEDVGHRQSANRPSQTELPTPSHHVRLPPYPHTTPQALRPAAGQLGCHDF